MSCGAAARVRGTLAQRYQGCGRGQAAGVGPATSLMQQYAHQHCTPAAHRSKGYFFRFICWKNSPAGGARAARMSSQVWAGGARAAHMAFRQASLAWPRGTLAVMHGPACASTVRDLQTHLIHPVSSHPQTTLARALYHRLPHHSCVGRWECPYLVASGPVLAEGVSVAKPDGRHEDVCKHGAGVQGSAVVHTCCRRGLRCAGSAFSMPARLSNRQPGQPPTDSWQVRRRKNLTVAARNAAPPVGALKGARPLPQPHEGRVVLDGVPSLRVIPCESRLQRGRGVGEA